MIGELGKVGLIDMISWGSFGSNNKLYGDAGFCTTPGSAHSTIFSLIGSRESVLEVGCSTGYFAEKLQTEKQCSVVGVEVDPEAAEQARQRAGIEVIVSSGEVPKLPAKYVSSFDVILCADVVEHTTDPLSFIKALKPYMLPTGRFIFSIPNIAHWSCRLMLLRGIWEYQMCGLLDYTHLRFFTYKTASRLMNESGLTVKSISYSYGPMEVYQRGIFGKNARLNNYLTGLVRYLSKKFPTFFAVQFIIEADAT